MRYLKKSLLTVLTVFTLFMVGAHGMEAKAATISNDSFAAEYSKSLKEITVGVVAQSDKYEVELSDAKGAVVANSQCDIYAYFNVKQNKLYYYRVRGLNYDRQSGTYVPVTEWSAKKAMWTPKDKAVKPTAVGSNRRVRFKAPKIAGIKKYNLYLSTKEKKGYKKAATIKPGKTVTLTKCKGKTFQYYKNYYYKIEPVLKKKAASVASYMGGFQLTKRYVF